MLVLSAQPALRLLHPIQIGLNRNRWKIAIQRQLTVEDLVEFSAGQKLIKVAELAVVAQASEFFDATRSGVPLVGMQQQRWWQKLRLKMAPIQMGMQRYETGLDDLKIQSDAAVAFQQPLNIDGRTVSFAPQLKLMAPFSIGVHVSSWRLCG